MKSAFNKKWLGWLALLFFLLGTSEAISKSLESLLKESVKDLTDIPQVKWIRVERDTVVIGWKGFPSFFNRVNVEAAVRGSHATGRRIRVWSVRHYQKNWVTGTLPYLCQTTGYRGRVEETSCRF